MTSACQMYSKTVLATASAVAGFSLDKNYGPVMVRHEFAIAHPLWRAREMAKEFGLKCTGPKVHQTKIRAYQTRGALKCAPLPHKQKG